MARTAEIELDEVVVSTETIKPSSPTPRHLFTHTLSRIDQLIPPIHVAVVLFYVKGDGADDGSLGPAGASEKLRLLKRSLSDALTLYYPLAGRINGGVSTVNCTDEGIVFIEARVSCPLSAVLLRKNPGDDESETVDRLLPCSRWCTVAGEPLLTVKASTFPCGGLAVGICLNHKVADGQSLAFFLKTWAAVARRAPDAEVGRPAFDVAAAAFTPLGMLPPPPLMPPAAERPLVTRRFVLDGSKICALREQSAGSPQQAHGRLTRVEAVTALLWRCLIRAYCSAAASFREKGAPAREFAACHAVGLRARMEPPFPETAFGNIVTTAITPAGLVVPTSEPRRPSCLGGVLDHDDEQVIDGGTLRRLTEELTSAAIRGMDGAYIRGTLQGPGGPFAFAGRLGEYLQRGARVVWFSSMWGFPFYEADFGWGRPAWVAWAGFDAVRMGAGVGLTGRREGGGHMVARVVLEAEEMEKLDKDPELLSLLSSDPLFP